MSRAPGSWLLAILLTASPALPAQPVIPVPEEGAVAPPGTPGGEPPAGGAEMDLTEAPGEMPTARATAVPPPARTALPVPEALEVRVAARRVVAGRVRAVPIEISAPPEVRALEALASLGEIDAPVPRGPGAFETTLSLPVLQGPAVALALFRGEGCAGYVRIPVWKAANLEIETEPGASVSVDVAGQTFGLVRAAGRVATVAVEIPPGAETAEVSATDRAGNRTASTIDLPRTAYPLALVVPPADTILADDGQILPLWVALANKTGAVPRDARVTVETGALGEPLEVQPGLRLYTWRPSRTLGARVFVVTCEDGETRRTVEMVAGAPSGIEVMAEPDILPADGLSTSLIHAGVTDGLGHFLAAGPIALEVAGGTIIQEPLQDGPIAMATVAADRMAPGGEPPAAIVVTARGAEYERVVAIRQFDPEARGLRLLPQPAPLVADGRGEAPVRIQLLDGLGDPLPVSDVASLSALGGEVPAEVPLVGGEGQFTFRAGTVAGIAALRAALGNSVAHATITLLPGAPDHMRVEIAEDPAAGPERYRVRARLEDAFGNGVGMIGDRPIAFRGTPTRGTVGPFSEEEVTGPESVGWMGATLSLPEEWSGRTGVDVSAGQWSGSAQVTRAAGAVVYADVMAGYAHNFGEVGLVPVRAGFGWLDAFGARGLLLGTEIGYQGFGFGTHTTAGEPYDINGNALTAYGVFGYRLPVASWFLLWASVNVGLEAAWLVVDQPGARDVTADGIVAFALGVRLAAGFVLGPGEIALELAYDDARFDDVGRGNLGGLGGLLGYRFEI